MIWATSWENLLLPYANNKAAVQPVHPHSLISSFVVRCLDNVIPLLAIAEISRPQLVSSAEQAGLNFNWLQTPKTGFLVTWLNYVKKGLRTSESVTIRAAMIHSPHDRIRIMIFVSWYDTYCDTLFRHEIISKCMRSSVTQWLAGWTFVQATQVRSRVWLSFQLASVLGDIT